MGKLKINDKVIIKATGEKGIVKGREVTNDGEKHVKVEYIVKTGDGFDKWKAYSKKELTKFINEESDGSKHLMLLREACNGYKVMTFGVVTNTKVVCDGFDSEGYYLPVTKKGKELRIGYSICHPSDNFDIKTGLRIARHRAKTNPFCHMVSEFGGEFDHDTLYAILKLKTEFITSNIDKFTKEKLKDKECINHTDSGLS